MGGRKTCLRYPISQILCLLFDLAWFDSCLAYRNAYLVTRLSELSPCFAFSDLPPRAPFKRPIRFECNARPAYARTVEHGINNKK